jgi:hypothetical protein
MRRKKTFLTLLRRLVALLEEEAARNSDFATRLEGVLSSPSQGMVTKKRSRAPKALKQLPDIYAESKRRGEAEFRLWLRDQPIEILRAVIRRHDLDAARRTHKWTDPEKLSAFVAEQLQARLARGSSFLRGGEAQR